MKYSSFFFAVHAFLFSQVTIGETFQLLDFKQLVTHSKMAVEVTVIDMQLVVRGFMRTPDSAKQSGTPLEEIKSNQQDIESPINPSSVELLLSSAPQSLPVEGGRMFFTDITLAVDREILGILDSDTIIIRVAGGSDGNVRAQVAGIPQFELGGRYLLFLRDEFEQYADPITGVNQGFFEIITSPDNDQDMLLNANGDIVTAVQNDHIFVRHNAERSKEPIRILAPPPTPESGLVTSAAPSPDVVNYWNSQRSPMFVDDFVAAVKAAKEELQ